MRVCPSVCKALFLVNYVFRVHELVALAFAFYLMNADKGSLSMNTKYNPRN